MASIVPTVESPPLIPLTAHATKELDSPVTLAENACALPVRTAAVAGDVVTAGWTLALPPVKPAHPAVAMEMRQRETVQIGKRLGIMDPRIPPRTRLRRKSSAPPPESWEKSRGRFIR